jgi:GntR family transcriptional regulator/MocR family aminotransferase
MELADLHLTLDRRGDFTARVYRGLLAAIQDGRLRPGDRLPPSRALAQSLAVSRGTVLTAYERLTAEGFLRGRTGDGTFVTGSPAPVRRRPPRSAIRPRAEWAAEPRRTNGERAAPSYDFRVGMPDATLFPYDVWRRLVSRELRLGSGDLATYGDPAGRLDLRSAIARYVGIARSVRADEDDVLVTSGAQQALDLVGRVMLRPGDIVAVEDPGYPLARALFASLGARVVGVPVDESGLVVDALPTRARLVYVTPSHQFPLGMAMSLARRRELLAWAGHRDAAVIEDDYDSEFRFSQRPLEPLHSLDTTGRVIYVGTFSKTLLPSLRLGFLVAPPTLRSALQAARQLSDGHSPTASQAALARFMAEGQLARHIRKASRIYGERHALVVDAIERMDDLELVPSTAGLHVCARLRSGDLGSVRALVTTLPRQGVVVDDVGQFCVGSAQAGFVFGYGGIPTGRIAEGMSRFRQALMRA